MFYLFRCLVVFLLNLILKLYFYNLDLIIWARQLLLRASVWVLGPLPVVSSEPNTANKNSERWYCFRDEINHTKWLLYNHMATKLGLVIPNSVLFPLPEEDTLDGFWAHTPPWTAITFYIAQDCFPYCARLGGVGIRGLQPGQKIGLKMERSQDSVKAATDGAHWSSGFGQHLLIHYIFKACHTVFTTGIDFTGSVTISMYDWRFVRNGKLTI